MRLVEKTAAKEGERPVPQPLSNSIAAAWNSCSKVSVAAVNLFALVDLNKGGVVVNLFALVDLK